MTFDNVSCSQCGASFGPGEHGFSHCDQHQPPEVWIPDLIRNQYDKAPDLGSAGCRAFDEAWDDGADDIARKIVERFAERHRQLTNALALILPLAKGYATAHPVGSNSAYVAQAAEVLAKATGAA